MKRFLVLVLLALLTLAGCTQIWNASDLIDWVRVQAEGEGCDPQTIELADWYEERDGENVWPGACVDAQSGETMNFAIGIDSVNPVNIYMAGSGKIFVSADSGQSWISHDIAGSGEQIEVAPTLPSIIFVASMRGGLYKSSDAGATWNTSHAGVCFCDIASLAAAPSAPETVYADIYAAYSLKASHDSGATWEERAFPAGCSGTFSDMLVNSNDPDVILALEDG